MEDRSIEDNGWTAPQQFGNLSANRHLPIDYTQAEIPTEGTLKRPGMTLARTARNSSQSGSFELPSQSRFSLGFPTSIIPGSRLPRHSASVAIWEETYSWLPKSTRETTESVNDGSGDPDENERHGITTRKRLMDSHVRSIRKQVAGITCVPSPKDNM